MVVPVPETIAFSWIASNMKNKNVEFIISVDNDGNKIKPALPIGTDRELIVNLGEQDISIAYYECDVYPNEITKIKKLDI